MTNIHFGAGRSVPFVVVGLVLISTGCVTGAPVSACYASVPAIAAAQRQSEAVISTYLQTVEERMASDGQFGFSLAVSACGKVVWTGNYGRADLENDVPVTSESRFRVGSVAKTLTAAALGQLVENGKLDLDAEIQHYVPGFPRKQHPITVRQLAGHLSGIRHYRNDEFFSAVHYDSVADALPVFANDPLEHRPGSAFLYSTYGWNVLAAVIEGASGETFLDYMNEHVFSVAGMKNTLADANSTVIPRRTRFYHFDVDTGHNENAPYVDLSNKWSGGGFLSTPADLLLFAHAMFDGRLVQPDTLELLTTSMTTDDGVATNYGIGWSTEMTARELGRADEYFDDAATARTARIIGEQRIIGHTGGSVGGLTLFIAAPDSDCRIVLAAVSNNDAFFPAFGLPVAAEFIDAFDRDR